MTEEFSVENNIDSHIEENTLIINKLLKRRNKNKLCNFLNEKILFISRKIRNSYENIEELNNIKNISVKNSQEYHTYDDTLSSLKEYYLRLIHYRDLLDRLQIKHCENLKYNCSEIRYQLICITEFFKNHKFISFGSAGGLTLIALNFIFSEVRFFLRKVIYTYLEPLWNLF